MSGNVKKGGVTVPTTERQYIPAAGSDWLLPFYDIFTKLLGVETAHRRLLEQAAIRPGYRVLEIGCGTGNLTILAKRLYPSADILGIDPDPQALSRAREKAHRAGLFIEFHQAFSEQLSFSDASFDRVLSAFMFHHIQPASKLPALRQICRVLKPGGSLHLVDFQEGEHPRGGHLAFVPHPHKESRFHYAIPHLLREAGFADPTEVAHQATIIGRIAYYIAIRPPVA